MSGSAQPIGVFDSGLGGLSILRHVRARLPHEHLIYVADAGYAPYGNRIRWRAAGTALAERTGGAARPPRRPVRDNLLTVDWSFVAP